MADYAILAQHPAHPNLLIGLPLEGCDSREDATDLAFHILHSCRVSGIFIPFDNSYRSGATHYDAHTTAGCYLVTYKLGPTTRLTAIEASSRIEAEAHLQHLSIEGRIITPGQQLT